MKTRLGWVLWLTACMAVGYFLSDLYGRTQVWNADRELLERLGVRPAPLPAFTAPIAEDRVATGLKFDLQENSGVDFVYDNGPEHQYHLAETLGGGLAALDYDNDDQVDLVFVDGGDPTRWPDNQSSRVFLYRQRKDGHFDALTASARLSWTGYGHGCAAVDVNNDGFEDLLVTGYQQCSLFLNQGDGTFQEEASLRELIGERWCATACWSDLDRDGDLDLYIACYADSPRDQPPPVCESKGVRIHCNPHSYRPVPDLLFENLGDGRFADRSESSGIASYREYGLGVVAADLDGDGATEIFVANDGDRNLLFRRTADWKYEELALANGLAFNGQGETMGSMGVACADFDRNGRLDLLTTNFSNESNALFYQDEGLMFVDTTQGTVLDHTSRALVGWGAVTLDADCDRLVDLFIANGHVTQMPGEDWAQLSKLLRGTQRDFEECRDAGPWFEQHWHARGAARADLNRDGLDDLVVSLIDAPPALLVNSTPSAGHRLQLQLVGTKAARTAEGALIEVTSDSGKRIELLARNAGYLSSNSGVLTIPLGDDETAEEIRIHWPGGIVQELGTLPAGRRYQVVEGREPQVMAAIPLRQRND